MIINNCLLKTEIVEDTNEVHRKALWKAKEQELKYM